MLAGLGVCMYYMVITYDFFGGVAANEWFAIKPIAAGAGAIWMQEGVIHEEAAAKATEAGIEVVMDRCLYKEWLRLMNG